MGASSDGSTVFVTGTTGLGRPSDAATLAYNASTGATKWVATYESSDDGHQRDEGTRLAVSPDGSSVFVTGMSACFDSDCTVGFDGWSTIAYDASTGAELWVARYSADIGAYSIAVSPDGSKVFVNGQRGGGAASATIAYDASTGEQLWLLESDDSPVYWQAVAVSPDSSTVFVATNVDWPATPTGCRTSAYDATDGTQKWSAVYALCSTGTALALAADGSKVALTGYSGASCCATADTVVYDAGTGTQLWATQDTEIREIGGDAMSRLAFSPDGSKVFLSGYGCKAYPCPEQPLATGAYDASTGKRLWITPYRSGGKTYPSDLAVSPDGSKVFVTGEEHMPCYSPCTTSLVNAPLVAYNASTGDELWVSSYENNNAQALAVNPDGSSVYLAGTFTAATATSSVARATAAASSCSPSACGYSTAAYNIRPGPGRAEDRDPSVRYDGWRTFFDQTALGGTYRASDTRGDNVRFRTAASTSLVWLTRRGPNQGRARVSIDGRSKGTFDLYGATASMRSFTFKGLPRTAHRVKVEILGTKSRTSSGSWVAVDGFKVGGNITVESSPRVRYGAWAGRFASAASGGSLRKSKSARAAISFVFTGTRVAFVTATGTAYGRAKVVIDGAARTVDLYRRTKSWRTKIWLTRLSPGKHRIKVRPLGTKNGSSSSTQIVFDAFLVRS